MIACMSIIMSIMPGDCSTRRDGARKSPRVGHSSAVESGAARTNPVLRQRGCSRCKVSVIAAHSIPPARRRVRACFGFLPDANYEGDAIADF